MGFSEFGCISSGDSIGEAFANAVSSAVEFYGNFGYTGTIADKDSYILMSPKRMTEAAAEKLGDKFLLDDDDRISDKMGPAGALLLDDGRVYFFGKADS